MHPLAPAALCLTVLAAAAQAQTPQTTLARQIEAASLTQNAATNTESGWVPYPPLSFRREMQVDGCDITSRVTRLDIAPLAQGFSGWITFDLARTRLPDPGNATDPSYVFLPPKPGSAYGTALLHLVFRPPYQPELHVTQDGQTQSLAVEATPFIMEPIPDDSQPLRLIELLALYQSDYCLPLS